MAVIAFSSGKGGVGKTSVSSNVASLLASQGNRTLVIDLDPQSNQAEVSFGVDDHDEGESLYRAVRDGDVSLLRPIPARRNLDLLPAGLYTAALEEDIVDAGMHQARLAGEPRITPLHRARACLEVRSLIAEAAMGYDRVIVDTPPAYGNAMAIAGLLASEYLVIPTRAGKLSRKGLEKLVRVWSQHELPDQPPTELLGVVVFGAARGATALVREEMAKLGDLFNDELPLLGVIRAAEKASFDQEEAGVLAVEYRTAAKTLRRKGGLRFAGNADGLVEDYEKVVEAIQHGVAAHQQRVVA